MVRSIVFFQGDYTRTGRRDLKGVLADGKISANRYYRRFKKDTLRQQCYDAMQKQNISSVGTDKEVITTVNSDLVDIPVESVNFLFEFLKNFSINMFFQTVNREEILKQMILDCRKMFVCEDTEDCFGTWPLIDDSESNE